MSARAALGGQGVRIGRWLVLVALVVLWQLAHVVLGGYTVASPMETVARLASLVTSGELLRHLGATLRVTLIGLAAGWVSGIAVALALARSERLAAAVEPFILASMGVPKFALAPLLILWFGIGDAPKAVVVTLMVFYVVFVTALAGARSVDRGLVSMARLVGASDASVTREVVLPSIVPFLVTGMKVAIPRAISAAVVGEFLVADSGLGFLIEHSRQTSDTVGVYAGLVVVAALVLAIDAGLSHAHRRTSAWRATAFPSGTL